MTADDGSGTGTEFYRDDVGALDRFIRLVGGLLAAGGASLVIEEQPAGLVVASVLLVGGLVYALVWPLQQYVVRDHQLIHEHWPRRNSVSLDEIVRVEAHWVLYGGNTLSFRDRAGNRLTIGISSANEELRQVIGQRLQDAHPMIARTSIMGPGATTPLGMSRSDRER